jgi:hypothetical protein
MKLARYSEQIILNKSLIVDGGILTRRIRMLKKLLMVGALVAGLAAGTVTHALMIDGFNANGISGIGSLCIGECVLQAPGILVETNAGQVSQFEVIVDPKTGDVVAGGGALDTAAGDILSVDLSGNVDPLIVAAIGAVDTGAPNTFSVAVVAPLVPTFPAGAQLSSTASIIGGLTDGSGEGNVSVSASLTPGALLETTINGTVVSTAGPAVTTTAVGVGGTLPYGLFTNVNTFLCPGGGCTSFDLLLSFTGAGGGDSYAFTGSNNVQQVQVPEPTTLALLGLGLAGLGFARRRRLNA